MAVIIFIILAVASVCLYDFIDGRNWQSATSTSRNTVIFENRNKKYGAYNLRSDYNDSFGIIIGIFTLSLLIISIVNANVRTTAVPVQLPKLDTIVMNIAAPPVEVIETIKTPYKISRSAGAGSPSNDPVIPKPMRQTQSSITTQNDKVVNSQSNKTNSEDGENKPSSMVKSANPFGSGGATSGRFSGIKGTKDSGPDLYSSSETHVKLKPRKQITRLSADDIQSNIACLIELKVYINAAGKVVDAKNDGKKTTTTENGLINKVIQLVREQIRFEESPGTMIQTQIMRINVSAR